MDYISRFLKYLEYEKRFSPNTIISYKNDLAQYDLYIKTSFAIGGVEEATMPVVRSWIVELMKSDYKARSVNRKLSALKAFYRWMKRIGVIQHNPAAKLSGPKKPERLPVYIRQDEMRPIQDEITFTDFPSLRDKLVIELLYCTGLRRSELLSLTYGHFNQLRKEIKVMGKGGKERIIPISQALLQMVIEYYELVKETFPDLRGRELILSNQGRAAYPRLIYNIVHDNLKLYSRAEKLSPHILRHSFATHLAENGADLNSIKELLGHANLSATEIYMHNTIDRIRSVYQKAHPKA